MNDGKNIYEIIKYMRKLYEQISILCQTSDKLLGKYDWECVHGNTCMFDSSLSLQSYSKWQPQYVFRFYMNNNEKNNNMIYISIILDDVNNDFKKFDEPLITAGFLKSKDNIDIETIKKNYNYLWSKFYVWSYSNKDGKIFEDFVKDWGAEAKDYPYLESTKLFAYRLTDITNENILNEKIISKLLEISK